MSLAHTSGGVRRTERGVRRTERGVRRTERGVREPGSARRTASREELAELQRARLLSAAIGALGELGRANVSVADIITRARVSRRTFYQLYANREECLGAVLRETLATMQGELAGAQLGRLVWRERIRQGLWRILCFLDREPVLARMCLVDTSWGSPELLATRERILTQLAAVVDVGRTDAPRCQALTMLTAEGLVGAAIAIVQSRVLRPGRQPLGALLGELTAMIVLPYLGPAAARREQDRPLPKPIARARQLPVQSAPKDDPLQGVEIRLTYRTAKVLQAIADTPGASNRHVAAQAGIADQGQASKLLARLEHRGLLANEGEGHSKGEANAWVLTPRGHRIAQTLHINTHARRAA